MVRGQSDDILDSRTVPSPPRLVGGRAGWYHLASLSPLLAEAPT